MILMMILDSIGAQGWWGQVYSPCLFFAGLAGLPFKGPMGNAAIHELDVLKAQALQDFCRFIAPEALLAERNVQLVFGQARGF